MAVSALFRSQLRRLGAVVRTRRMRMGLSQEQFAELARCDRTYVGEVERGEVNMTAKHVMRFARAMEIKVSEWWHEAGL